MSYKVLSLILTNAYIKTEDLNDMEMVDILVPRISVIQESVSAIKVVTIIVIYLVIIFTSVHNFQFEFVSPHSLFCIILHNIYPHSFFRIYSFLNGSEESLWF